MRVLHLLDNGNIIQLDVEVLIHALQRATHGNVILELHRHLVVDESLEEAVGSRLPVSDPFFVLHPLLLSISCAQRCWVFAGVRFGAKGVRARWWGLFLGVFVVQTYLKNSILTVGWKVCVRLSQQHARVEVSSPPNARDVALSCAGGGRALRSRAVVTSERQCHVTINSMYEFRDLISLDNILEH